MNRLRAIAAVGAIAATVSACAAAKGSFVFNRLEYPVSMSTLLAQPDGTPAPEGSLQVVGTFKVSKRFWGMLWGFVRLTGDHDISAEINRKIKEKGGDGVTMLSVTSENCGLPNSIPVLNWVPIVPACAIGVLRGQIVKYTPPAGASAATAPVPLSVLTPDEVVEQARVKLEAELNASLADRGTATATVTATP